MQSSCSQYFLVCPHEDPFWVSFIAIRDKYFQVLHLSEKTL